MGHGLTVSFFLSVVVGSAFGFVRIRLPALWKAAGVVVVNGPLVSAAINSSLFFSLSLF